MSLINFVCWLVRISLLVHISIAAEAEAVIKSISLETEKGIDLLSFGTDEFVSDNRNLLEVVDRRSLKKLSLRLTIDSKNVENYKTKLLSDEKRNAEHRIEPTSILCDLSPISTLCPFHPDVIVDVYKSDTVENTPKYRTRVVGNQSCSTFVTTDYKCIVTITKSGIKGLFLENDIRAIEFSVDKYTESCRDNASYCATAFIASTVPDCKADTALHSQGNYDAGNDDASRLAGIQSKSKEPWLELWEGCYPGVNRTNSLHMGFAIGSELVRILGGSSNAVTWLENTVAEANSIYLLQLNVKLTIKHIVIVDPSNAGSKSWDNPGCERSIDEQLIYFRDHERESEQGLWHYLDACVIDNGPVGLGFVGTLCSARFGVGVTNTKTGRGTWLTFAHEVGHNFGARHSFEEGSGKTGGIMDYGSKKLDGKYQFNRKYREKELCGKLTGYINAEECRPFWTSVDPICGDGVLAPTEMCECYNGETDCACCSNCFLTAAAECSPFNNQCCTDDCRLEGPSKTCSIANENGYCNHGRCEDTICQLYGLGDFCGVHSEEESCKIKCRFQGICMAMNGWMSLDGKPLNVLPNGTLCRTPAIDRGECHAGICVSVSSVPVAPDTVSPTILVTSFPTVARIASKETAETTNSSSIDWVVIIIICLGLIAFPIITRIVWRRLQQNSKIQNTHDEGQGETGDSSHSHEPNHVTNNENVCKSGRSKRRLSFQFSFKSASDTTVKESEIENEIIGGNRLAVNLA